MKTASELRQHVLELAAAFKVQVRWHMLPPDFALSGQIAQPSVPMSERQNVVMCADITDETTYAVALHEMGHCLHPLGRVHWIEGTTHFRQTSQPSTLRDVRLLVLAERSAWEWAHQFALEWTPAMDFVERVGMDSYLQLAKRYGAKEKP